jgi:hypothetical protein
VKPMIRYEIRFEEWGKPGSFSMAESFLPIGFRVWDISTRPQQIAFVLEYGSIESEYRQLQKELGDKLQKATVRWAVSCIEELLRSPAAEALFESRRRESHRLVLDRAELAIIGTLLHEKTCEYQIRPSAERDLFCAAAGREDRSAVGNQELRKLAPTSRPICKACTMPDNEYVCSHLSHPQVLTAAGTNRRQLLGAFCEEDQPGVTTHPWLCYAGGHPCWTRMVAPEAQPTPLFTYDPRELPTALDFFSTIREKAIGHPPLRLRSAEKTAALSLGCATHDEFRARLGDLNEIFKLFDIPNGVLPKSETTIPKEQILNRMDACLHARIADEATLEAIAGAIDDLRAMNTVRNKLTHGGSELVRALGRLEIEFPIRDYCKAWDRVRAKVAEAVSTIRSAFQNVLYERE